MKHFFTFLFFCFTLYTSSAQVGIGTSTPEPAAALDITSTDKGLLIPRVTLANRPGSPGKAAPTAGLMIYQTDIEPGFYVYDGTNWERLVKKSEAAPQGFIYLTLGLQNTDNFVAPNTLGVTLPLIVQYSTLEYTTNNNSYNLTLPQAGTYSVDFGVEPINVSGNPYGAILYVNGQSVHAAGLSSTSNIRTYASDVIVTVAANSNFAIRISPAVTPGNIAPSQLFFYSSWRGAYMKITRLR